MLDSLTITETLLTRPDVSIDLHCRAQLGEQWTIDHCRLVSLATQGIYHPDVVHLRAVVKAVATLLPELNLYNAIIDL